MKLSPLQKVANKIARHFARQKEQSMGNRDFVCRYRVEDSCGKLINSCAVGCLIPKHLYSPAIEGLAVRNSSTKRVPKRLYFVFEKWGISPTNKKDAEFLQQAQNIHDSSWDRRNEKFKSLCEEYGLKYNPK
jgi:hypothetical protein